MVQGDGYPSVAQLRGFAYTNGIDLDADIARGEAARSEAARRLEDARSAVDLLRKEERHSYIPKSGAWDDDSDSTEPVEFVKRPGLAAAELRLARLEDWLDPGPDRDATHIAALELGILSMLGDDNSQAYAEIDELAVRVASIADRLAQRLEIADHRVRFLRAKRSAEPTHNESVDAPARPETG